MGRPLGVQVEKMCLTCHERFTVRLSLAAQECCSKACAGFQRGQSDKPCLQCGVIFNPRSNQRFCSHQCQIASLQTAATMEFIESNSIPEPNTGCWIWLGALDSKGYGLYGGARHRRFKAHRKMLELKLCRPLTDDEVTRHSCDNPPCVNPDHLMVGSINDNNQDCIRRGRHAFGSRIAAAKLSEVDIEEIQKMLNHGEYQRIIGERFGVTQGAISHIVNGRSWVRAIRYRRKDAIEPTPRFWAGYV